MKLNRGDVWGHFAPMFHLVDVFAVRGPCWRLLGLSCCCSCLYGLCEQSIVQCSAVRRSAGYGPSGSLSPHHSWRIRVHQNSASGDGCSAEPGRCRCTPSRWWAAATSSCPPSLPRTPCWPSVRSPASNRASSPASPRLLVSRTACVSHNNTQRSLPCCLPALPGSKKHTLPRPPMGPPPSPCPRASHPPHPAGRNPTPRRRARARERHQRGQHHADHAGQQPAGGAAGPELHARHVLRRLAAVARGADARHRGGWAAGWLLACWLLGWLVDGWVGE